MAAVPDGRYRIRCQCLCGWAARNLSLPETVPYDGCPHGKTFPNAACFQPDELDSLFEDLGMTGSYKHADSKRH
jgi:hypothetical protein